jgi:hypothetical protein
MTDPVSRLAKRLAENPAWEWQGGALTTCGIRVYDGGRDWLVGHRSGSTRDGGGDVDTTDTSGFMPDMNDSATVGTIEGQVRVKCPGLIMFPPDSLGEDYAISKGPIAGDGSCLCYAKTLGEVWAMAFLEVHGGR